MNTKRERKEIAGYGGGKVENIGQSIGLCVVFNAT